MGCIPAVAGDCRRLKEASKSEAPRRTQMHKVRSTRINLISCNHFIGRMSASGSSSPADQASAKGFQSFNAYFKPFHGCFACLCILTPNSAQTFCNDHCSTFQYSTPRPIFKLCSLCKAEHAACRRTAASRTTKAVKSRKQLLLSVQPLHA